MKTEDVGELWAGAETHLKRPAKLRIDGEEYRVKVSAAGSSTIREAKKSLTIKFEDREFNGQREYRLATTIRDRSMIRSLIARDVFLTAGVPSPELEPVFVYLNDHVMGLYIGTEMINEQFFARRQIPVKQWYELKEMVRNGGSDPHTNEAYSFVAKPEPNLELMIRVHRLLDTPGDAEFESRIFGMVDRESFVAYLAAGQILNHWDGFNKNVVYMRPLPAGKLRVAAWDFDFTWYPGFRLDPQPWRTNELWRRIGKLPSVSADYEARVTSFKAGPLALPVLQGKIAEWREKIRSAYNADPFLGGLGQDLDHQSQLLYDTIAAWYPRIP